jgi:hypothetical protein
VILSWQCRSDGERKSRLAAQISAANAFGLAANSRLVRLPDIWLTSTPHVRFAGYTSKWIVSERRARRHSGGTVAAGFARNADDQRLGAFRVCVATGFHILKLLAGQHFRILKHHLREPLCARGVEIAGLFEELQFGLEYGQEISHVVCHWAAPLRRYVDAGRHAGSDERHLLSWR